LAVLAAVLLGAAGVAGTGLAAVFGSGLSSLTNPDQPAAGPGVTLDKALEQRFATAKQAAAAVGVDLFIAAGVRPADQQRRAFEAAVAEYGSAGEAAKHVARPEASAHVKGHAIDVGPGAGWAWLAGHQGEFGLCQTNLNEPWHFEAKVAPGETCAEPADGQPAD
jgi:LAS superfamily LD-carboxypeptidase LdcB